MPMGKQNLQTSTHQRQHMLNGNLNCKNMLTDNCEQLSRLMLGKHQLELIGPTIFSKLSKMS
jgi:hypothetical protein